MRNPEFAVLHAHIDAFDGEIDVDRFETDAI